MTRVPRTINLHRGWPASSLLPIAQVSAAAQRALANPAIAIPGMLYGDDEGYGPLREALARWLTSFYEPSRAIAASRITISGGASQSMACILSTFTDPLFTRHIWIVAPAYFMAFKIFEDAGFGGKMRSLREGPDGGVDVEWFKAEVAKVEKERRKDKRQDATTKAPRRYEKLYPHVIYAVPSFANPSSTTMTLERRKQLIECARETDALIICDDVYDMLQWSSVEETPSVGRPKAVLPRLVDLDREMGGGIHREGADGFGNAISNGSFSKICGPGCRSGWVEGSDEFSYRLSQTGATKSGGAASQLTATFMEDLLRSGQLQKHIIETLQPAYAQRYHTLSRAVQQHLAPLGVTTHQQERDIVGGYFLWLQLPSGMRCDVVVAKAKADEALLISPGTAFEVPGDLDEVYFNSNLRLCYAMEDVDFLVEGVERLARVIESLQEQI